MKTLGTMAILAAFLVVSCASKPVKRGSAVTGSKVLEGVVVERDREAPSSGGASFRGPGDYYLVFEVREGDATARYRYTVTYQQWFRFPEGSHVRITLRNNFLQDIQSIE
ncbi:MAG: hypothetical protein ABI968_03900 [Acidobacteriota bacterium]